MATLRVIAFIYLLDYPGPGTGAIRACLVGGTCRWTFFVLNPPPPPPPARCPRWVLLFLYSSLPLSRSCPSASPISSLLSVSSSIATPPPCVSSPPPPSSSSLPPLRLHRTAPSNSMRVSRRTRSWGCWIRRRVRLMLAMLRALVSSFCGAFSFSLFAFFGSWFGWEIVLGRDWAVCLFAHG